MRKRRFHVGPRWRPTGKVSPTCEVMRGGHTFCGKPTTHAYPAMGGGYMPLCTEHAQPHLVICVTYQEALEGKEPPSTRWSKVSP